MSTVAAEAFLQISECGIVTGATLLAFDYCLTFGKEVKWVHGTRWTTARIHFTSSRYLPFLAIAMAIPTSRVVPLSETDYCGPLGMATNVLYYLCIILAEVMLIVRTYAFWRRNRKILIGMCSFGFACIAGAIIVSQTVGLHTTDAVYKALNCPGSDSPVATAMEYLCLIIYEMGMLALNCIAFWRMRRRNPPGHFITALYRDGVVYVAAVLGFSVINAIVSLTTSVQYSDVLNSPQLVMHSILASRIFFNLRETAQREQSDSADTPLTAFHAPGQGSSGFSDSLGTASSSNRNIDPATQVVERTVVEA